MSAAVAGEGTVTLDADQVKAIRSMLLIGLYCYGEGERVRNYWDMQGEDACGSNCGGIPLEPTGDASTVSEFAEALRMLA